MKKTRNDGVYYLIAGVAGCAFLVGSYHGNKFPMNNLWDAQSLSVTVFFLIFILIGIYKLAKRHD